MKLTNYRNTYKGYFTYEKGYNDAKQQNQVAFTITIDINNGSFTGVWEDEESKPLFNKNAIVKGFIEEDMFSFVLKYPYSYFRMETGELVTDKNLNHPDINYLGYLSEDKKEVSGHWEFFEEEIYIDQNTHDSYITSGEFIMRKS